MCRVQALEPSAKEIAMNTYVCGILMAFTSIATGYAASNADRDQPTARVEANADVAARELVHSQLTADQIEQTTVILGELKKTYGDEVALHRAKARWAEVRANMTGSRVGSVGHLDVGVPQASADPSMPTGGKGVHRTSTTPAEILGGQGVDGSIAY